MKLVEITRHQFLNNTREHINITQSSDDSDNLHAYHVNLHERPQRCQSWQMKEVEHIEFIFNNSVSSDFIKMKLFATNSSPIDSSEDLIDSIKDHNSGKECDITRHRNNFYEILCKHHKNDRDNHSLRIKSNSSSPIDIAMCEIDVGYVEQECGLPDKPIGGNYYIHQDGINSDFSCNEGLQLIGDEEYKCSHGLWSPISHTSNYGFTECHNTSLCPFSQLPYFDDNLDHDFFDAHNGIVRLGQGVKYRCADNPINTNEDYPNPNELGIAVPIKPNWLCDEQLGWISYGTECKFGLARY